jgi:2-dehydropantoate 2-reductase
MNIAVIGIGGVGGYFGGKLTQLLNNTGDLNIYFVARGQHLSEIRKNGLVLDTDEGVMTCKPTFATDNISGLPNIDFYLLCVKSFDLDDVLLKLKEKVTSSTIILPLLNGVDIYEKIKAKIKNGVVLPSCVYIGTHIERPGKVTQRGGACTIFFGRDPGNNYFDDRIMDLFKRANIKYQFQENPYIEIWNKFIFVAPFGLVTANFDKTFGEVLLSEELSNYVRNIMNEIITIAKKKDVFLSSDIINEVFTKAKGFPFETKSSFQRDFENREKPDERELFGGSIIRMGKELGLAVKITQAIYDSIQKKKKIIN